MAQYTLAHQISYCQIGSRLVFLDVSRDRYFRLGKDLETALLAYLSGGTPEETCVRKLIKKGVLVEESAAIAERQPLATLPSESAMEMAEVGRRNRLTEVLEVFLLVIHTRIRLRLSTLESILDDYVQREESPHSSSGSREDTPHLLAASAAFRRVRLFVPVNMRCLVDSIALTRFLRRRGLQTRLVFGVALDPFSAHCWVQASDLVLNDTVGNVRCHTAIRTV